MAFAADETAAEGGFTEATTTRPDGRSAPNADRPGGLTMTRDSTVGAVSVMSSQDSILPESSRSRRSIELEHDVHAYPHGWARYAREQNKYDNGPVYRCFAYLSKRLLLYRQGRISHLVDQLWECDMASTTGRKRLSAGQRRKAGEDYTPEQEDLIMEEVDKELKRYDRALRYDREIQKLPRPPTAEMLAFRATMKKRGLLDEEALAFLKAPDDFVSTRPAEAHSLIFRKLSYSAIGGWLPRVLPVDKDTGAWKAESNVLRWTMDVFEMMFCVSFLLVPVAVLYLGNLSKITKFLAVLLSVFLFTAAVVLAKGGLTKFRHTVIVVFTYAAILLSALVQIG